MAVRNFKQIQKMKTKTVVLDGTFIHVAIDSDETVFFDTEIRELTFQDVEKIYLEIKAFKNELIVGVRYWLDSCKDISGVYIGLSDKKSIQFNDILGDKCPYIKTGGIIRFALRSDTITPV